MEGCANSSLIYLHLDGETTPEEELKLRTLLAEGRIPRKAFSSQCALDRRIKSVLWEMFMRGKPPPSLKEKMRSLISQQAAQSAGVTHLQKGDPNECL